MHLGNCHNFHDFRALAKRQLPQPIFDYIDGAADDEATLRQNTASFERCDLVPNILRGVETIDRWLADRLALEPARAGALRVVYFERQTGEFTRAVGQRIATRIAARLPGLDPPLAAVLARRYKIEVSGVVHARIADRCLPELLARADAEFDWLS